MKRLQGRTEMTLKHEKKHGHFELGSHLGSHLGSQKHEKNTTIEKG